MHQFVQEMLLQAKMAKKHNYVCTKCPARFDTPGGLNSHKARGCKPSKKTTWCVSKNNIDE